MPLNLYVDKLEDVPENQREFYKQDEATQKYALDVEGGAVSSATYETLKNDLEAAKRLGVDADGKSFKDKFEGSQTANRAIRKERDGFESELRKWQELGTREDVATWKDELDGLKAKGQKLDDLQTQINELKKANREYAGKLEKANNQNSELTTLNKELSEFKETTTRQLDMADAEAKIATVVDGIQGANVLALKRNLVDRYKTGDLVRDQNTGLLVSADSKQSLAEYAKETMEAYGLYVHNVPGFSKQGATPSSSPKPFGGQTTPESLAAMFR